MSRRSAFDRMASRCPWKPTAAGQTPPSDDTRAIAPLKESGEPDLGLFAAHCARLLAEGCHGIALLGTTGEANSFSQDERRAILESALAAGIAADRLMPGTGVAAIPRGEEDRDASALLL